MKIHEYASAPNCRRVRMYLAEKGIEDVEYVLVDFGKVAKLRPDPEKHPNLVCWREQLNARPSASA